MTEQNTVNRILRDMSEQDQPVEVKSPKLSVPPHMRGYVNDNAASARGKAQQVDHNLNSVPTPRKP